MADTIQHAILAPQYVRLVNAARTARRIGEILPASDFKERWLDLAWELEALAEEAADGRGR